MTALAFTLAAAFAQEKAGAPEKTEVRERVTVNRVIVTGRVLDRFANPIPGLTTGDFRVPRVVRVEGRPPCILTGGPKPAARKIATFCSAWTGRWRRLKRWNGFPEDGCPKKNQFRRETLGQPWRCRPHPCRRT